MRSSARADEDAAAQIERFIERYEQIYGKGSAFPGAGTQIALFKLLARGKVRTPAPPELERRPTAESGSRDVYWREFGEFRLEFLFQDGFHRAWFA